MSIITIRSWFENRGCQVVLVVVAILLGIGLIFPMLSMGYMGGPTSEAGKQTLFEVAGQKVTASELERLSEGRPLAATDPAGRLNELGSRIERLVQDAALAQLAAKYQVKLTDAQIRTFVTQQFEQQEMLARMQMQFSKQLPENATDKQFEEAYKKLSGMTPAEMRKRALGELEGALKDPERRASLEKEFLRDGVQAAVMAKISVTEEEVKKTYDTFFLNRMAVALPGKSEAENKAAAEKAAADLKAGKSFAEVYRAALGQAPPAPTEMTRGMLEADPANEPILKLKPNEVSPVITSFGSPTVYQLVKVEQKLPPDFEKNKANILTSMKQQRANKTLQEELKPYQEGTGVKWEDKNTQLIFRAFQAVNSKRAEMDKPKFEALLEEVRTAYGSSPGEGLAMAQHVLFDEVFRLSTSDQQKEMKEERAEVITTSLDYLENSSLRLDLVNIHQELGNKEQAFLEMETALRNSTGAFEPENQAQVTSLETRAFALEREKFFTKEQGDQLREIIVQWRKEKAQHEAEQKELEKLAAEEQKKLEEEDKKMMEEEKKREAEEARKAGSAKPSTSSGGAPAPGTPAPGSAPSAPSAPGFPTAPQGGR